MKLQLALDVLSLKKALSIAEKTKKYIDIIEAGTPLIKQEGLKSVEKLKKQFPKKIILADMKTMDTGFMEAEMAFKAGADIVNICGAADNQTIAGAVEAAKKYKKEIIVDLVGVKNLSKRARDVLSIGADRVEVHTGIDQQNSGRGIMRYLKKIHDVKRRYISVAGGINARNIKDVVMTKPHTIVVGGYITKSKEPEKAAKLMKDIIKKA